MILSRYLKNEIWRTTAVITGVLLLVLLSNQAIRYLHWVAQGRLSIDLLLKMMGIQIPILLTFLLPLGLYLGILLTYGRLYADHEMSILSTSGMSRWRLLRITLSAASIITLIVSTLMHQAKPTLYHYQQQWLSHAAQNPLHMITPGQFQSFSQGKWIVYAQKRVPQASTPGTSKDAKSNPTQGLDNIFMIRLSQNHTHPQPFDIISAKHLRQEIHPVPAHHTPSQSASPPPNTSPESPKDRYLVFHNGHRYQGTPGTKDFRILTYQRLGIRQPKDSHQHTMSAEKYTPSLALWQQRHTNHLANVELQWRFAIPLSTFILALLALPLSELQPRQGRYRKFLPALLLYLVYMQLLFTVRTWAKQEIIAVDPFFLFTAVHCLALITTYALWQRQRKH